MVLHWIREFPKGTDLVHKLLRAILIFSFSCKIWCHLLQFNLKNQVGKFRHLSYDTTRSAYLVIECPETLFRLI